jgi:hypothetical protein
MEFWHRFADVPLLYSGRLYRIIGQRKIVDIDGLRELLKVKGFNAKTRSALAAFIDEESICGGQWTTDFDWRQASRMH